MCTITRIVVMVSQDGSKLSLKIAVYNMKGASLHLVQATNNGQQTVKTGMRRFYFTSHGMDLTSSGVQNNAVA